jgi:hypothetical protein
MSRYPGDGSFDVLTAETTRGSADYRRPSCLFLDFIMHVMSRPSLSLRIINPAKFSLLFQTEWTDLLVELSPVHIRK